MPCAVHNLSPTNQPIVSFARFETLTFLGGVRQTSLPWLFQISSWLSRLSIQLSVGLSATEQLVLRTYLFCTIPSATQVLPGEHSEAADRGRPPADPGAGLVATLRPAPRRGHRRAAGGGAHLLPAPAPAPARREYFFSRFSLYLVSFNECFIYDCQRFAYIRSICEHIVPRLFQSEMELQAHACVLYFTGCC